MSTEQTPELSLQKIATALTNISDALQTMLGLLIELHMMAEAEAERGN